MAIPLTRNTTYASLSIVDPNDLNALQDWIINLYAGAHGARIKMLSPAAGGGWDLSGTANLANNQNGAVSSKNTGATAWSMQIAEPVGNVLTTVAVTVQEGDTAGETVTLRLFEVDPGSAPVALATEIVTEVDGNVTTYTWADLDYEFVDGKVVVVTMAFAQSSSDTEIQVRKVKTVTTGVAP